MDKMQLILGTDIPFSEGSCTIHQPTLEEISYIGEDVLFTGCGLLKFSKENLTSEDKTNLNNFTDFNIIMSIINDKGAQLKHNISCAKMVLDLLFPLYTVIITPSAIILAQGEEIKGQINELNYLAFRKILVSIFCLNNTSTEYNVEGDLAKKIADKLKNYHQKLAQQNPRTQKVAIFEKYISILTVGEHKDMNSFRSYTVYQLFDEFQRFGLKSQHDLYVKQRLAGAENLKAPDDWMKDIHDGE